MKSRGDSNPFEFREVARALVRWNEDRSVDQVLKEQKAKRDARSKRRGAKGSGKAAPAQPSTPRKSQLNALDEIMAKAREERAKRGIPEPPQRSIGAGSGTAAKRGE